MAYLEHLNTVNAYTNQQFFAETTLTDAASIAWNLDDNQTTKVTITADRTLANPTNLKAGGTYIVRVIQDGTGGHTIAFGANYVHAADSSQAFTVTLPSGAGQFATLSFYCDGTKMIG